MNRALLPAVLALVSLGLPWGGAQWTYGTDLTLVPGGCWTDSTGWMTCEPMSSVLAPTAELGPAAAGLQTSARVLVPLAVILLVVALRRGSIPAARGFVVVAVLAVAVGGLIPTAGLLLFAAAVALGLQQVKAAGIRVRPVRPRPGPPPLATHQG